MTAEAAIVTLREVAPLPLTPDTSVVRLALDDRGAPMVAATPREFADVARGTGAGSGLAERPYPVTVHRCERGSWTSLGTLICDVVSPHLQVLPDGAIALISPFCRRISADVMEETAVRYRDGVPERRFALGDGIEDVQVSGDGVVWAAFSDRGTTGDFGVAGWGRLGRDEWVDPVGMSGLVAFTGDGTPVAELDPPAGLTHAVDCFALNVWDREVWVSYFPDFAIVCRSATGQLRAWSMPVAGSDAICTDGKRAIAYTSYGIHRGRCVQVTLADGQAELPVPLDARLPDGAPLRSAQWVRGKGAALHAVAGSRWYRLDLDDVAPRPAC
ncbi:hypothetical protein [Pseudonocardia alni]|uniref:hypothetical protein n=1 Tax=Pseudonocardia alni TaxID=33907 RepID=UPI00332E8EC9